MGVIRKLPTLIKAESESMENIKQLKILIHNYIKSDEKEVIKKIREEQRVNLSDNVLDLTPKVTYHPEM